MVISAKEFAQETGFPVKLIRRLCRTGVLEHWMSGKVYLLDRDKAMAKMELLKARPIYEPKKPERCRKTKKLPTEYVSIKDYFKAKMKQKKTAGAGTPTAK